MKRSDTSAFRTHIKLSGEFRSEAWETAIAKDWGVEDA